MPEYPSGHEHVKPNRLPELTLVFTHEPPFRQRKVLLAHNKGVPFQLN